MLRAFAEQQKLVMTDEITFPHTSSGDPEFDSAIDGIIERRTERKDFDVLVIPDLARLTSTGMQEVLRLIRRMAAAGITVVAPTIGDIGERLLAECRSLAAKHTR